MTSTSPRFIKKAHAAIICGATDCGKTEFTINLLETEYKQLFKYIIIICPTWRYNQTYLTLKEPGFLDPSHSRGGGGFRPPLRSRKPIDETSSVWY